jgi:hypothetical protein
MCLTAPVASRWPSIWRSACTPSQPSSECVCVCVCVRRQHRCVNPATLATRACHISLMPTMSARCSLEPLLDRYWKYCLCMRPCSHCPCGSSGSVLSIFWHNNEQGVDVFVCTPCRGDSVTPVTWGDAYDDRKVIGNDSFLYRQVTLPSDQYPHH